MITLHKFGCSWTDGWDCGRSITLGNLHGKSINLSWHYYSWGSLVLGFTWYLNYKLSGMFHITFSQRASLIPKLFRSSYVYFRINWLFVEIDWSKYSDGG